MPSSPNQRLKLLYLMKILLERTDAQNPLTIAEILGVLGEYGIKAERKSIYTDMELLRHFGIDIETHRSKTVAYYVAERQFELPELKLLVDAVQSSHFISRKRSEGLIKKLSSLTSAAQAKQLRRQVFVADRAKTINETVYYSIDQIHYAIGENKQIVFKYFDYDTNKKRVYRKGGKQYRGTPVALCWNEDNYYLIIYSAWHDDFTHYRVDRMSNVDVLDADGESYDHNKLNIAERTKRMFGMYDGETVRATLSFNEKLVNVVLDHFGKDVHLSSAGEGWFDIRVDVSISPMFLAWMFGLGDLAVIKSPDNLIAAMRELLNEVCEKYECL